MYKELKFDEVIRTIANLQNRISERVPNAGIGRVCGELLNTAREAQARIEKLSQPNRWIRAGVVAAISSFILLLIYTASVVKWEVGKPNLVEIIQITEALINDVILLGAALFFLLTFERRLKTRSVLKSLHQLRSIAHIVDMHQLTKDPAMIEAGAIRTRHSPERSMTAFEMQRYLDYCSEMFSLIGKIAALFSEKLPEPEIVAAANDVEDLCTGLSRKVWQKMFFLDKAHSS